MQFFLAAADMITMLKYQTPLYLAEYLNTVLQAMIKIKIKITKSHEALTFKFIWSVIHIRVKHVCVRQYFVVNIH